MREFRRWCGRGSVVVAAGLVVALASLAQGAPAQQMHRLEAGPSTVAFGYYWSEAEPVLRIASGDIIDVDTMLTSNPNRLEAMGLPPDQVQQSLRDIYEQVPREDRGPGGHILTGPVYVEGAEPGDVLQVDVLEIDLPIAYGYNGCSGFTRENCPEKRADRSRLFWFDVDSMTTDFAPGIVIPLRPFFGSMGVAPPPDAGRWSSVPPWIHAGNIDNKELVAGTTLYIPVWVPGALFEIGDGHAAQGDGEVDQTAIETSLRGRLRLTVRKDMSLEWPVAETDTHWITMGSDEDLTEATRIAIDQTIVFLGDRFGLPRGEAYRLISLAIDLRITQLVDQKVGVHAMIPKAIFRRER
ncbi:MAG: acetamidase/formamidase family protein [Acidobacteria bacterium]|nr:acetamidase/formamidase family protein [Acidobacteriota bacterium]